MFRSAVHQKVSGGQIVPWRNEVARTRFDQVLKLQLPWMSTLLTNEKIGINIGRNEGNSVMCGLIGAGSILSFNVVWDRVRRLWNFTYSACEENCRQGLHWRETDALEQLVVNSMRGHPAFVQRMSVAQELLENGTYIASVREVTAAQAVKSVTLCQGTQKLLAFVACFTYCTNMRSLEHQRSPSKEFIQWTYPDP